MARGPVTPSSVDPRALRVRACVMRHGLYLLRRGGGTWYAVQPCCCITLTSASKLSYQYRWQMALRNSLRLYYTIFGTFFPLYHIFGCESMPP